MRAFQREVLQERGGTTIETASRLSTMRVSSERRKSIRQIASCLLGWLFAVTRLPIIGGLIERAYSAFAAVRTDLTRGERLEALIEARETQKNAREDGQTQARSALDQ